MDDLKIIQLGLTFCKEDGELPPGISTWQFNFPFCLGYLFSPTFRSDRSKADSITLLRNAGLNFELYKTDGIDTNLFGEHMFTAGGCTGVTNEGLALNEDLKWISFHGVYDFAHILKLVTSEPLPNDEKEFQQQLQLYFPHHYDVKQMIAGLYTSTTGLSKTAELLGVLLWPAHRSRGSAPNIRPAATVS